MVDLVGNIKSAYELIKALMRDISEARLQGTLSELLTKMNDITVQVGETRVALLELQEECDRLRRENDQLHAWNNEKEQYVLEQLGSGGFVYVARNPDAELHGKKSKDGYLCACCFDQGRKSVLQFSGTTYDGTHYVCYSCKSVVLHPEGREKLTAHTVPIKNKWDSFV